MVAPSMRREMSASLGLLAALPGIPDVVWAVVTRLESVRVPTTILFTSTEERAGTSVLAAATAIGLARHGRFTVGLVETNVARPALAGYLGLEGPGLSDALDGRAQLDDCIREVKECPGLLVVPGGTPRPEVSGEFTTDQLNAILAKLGKRCRFIVLDTPPLLDNVGSRLLLRHADGAVLVLRARITQRSDAERAHDILVESGTRILGSIFNDYRTESPLKDFAANRAFQEAVRAVKAHTGHRNVVRETVPPPTNGKANGVHEEKAYVVPRPYTNEAESAHLRQIDLLERRIAKLTQELEATEAALRHIAAMKNVDLGVASIYRGVQGLSSEDEARETKKQLLQQIFEANMQLQDEIAKVH